MSEAKSPLLEYALRYYELGWSVIPALSGRKTGSTVKWARYQTQRADVQTIERWFENPGPDLGIGIVTGEISKLVVPDLDVHGENDGVQYVKTMYGWAPEGPVVRTGGGGLHPYYKLPSGVVVPSKVGLFPGVDIRGEGGFVYAPPSPHPSGKHYEWDDPPWDCELPPLPEWLLKEITGQKKKTQKLALDDELARLDELEALLVSGVSEGLRNDTAARLAGRYLAQGLSIAAAEAILITWNLRNKPPLPAKEISIIVRSIQGKEDKKRQTLNGNGAVGAPVAIDERASVLEALSERFKVKLDDIVRIGGSAPMYRFFCAGRSVDIGARDIGSQWEWRRCMIAATETVPTKLGPKAEPPWDYYLQIMLDVARDIEPGDEATDRGQLRDWLHGYLETRGVIEDGDASIEPNDPQRRGDALHIHVSSLRKFVLSEFGVRLTNKRLVQVVSSEGFERRVLRIRLERGGDKTRSMWRVPAYFEPSKGDSA